MGQFFQDGGHRCHGLSRELFTLVQFRVPIQLFANHAKPGIFSIGYVAVRGQYRKNLQFVEVAQKFFILEIVKIDTNLIVKTLPVGTFPGGQVGVLRADHHGHVQGFATAGGVFVQCIMY